MKKERAPSPPTVPKLQTQKSSVVSIAVTEEDVATGQISGAVARTMTNPAVSAAAVIESWQQDTHDVNALADVLAGHVAEVNAGSLARAEGMLISQAHALDAVFANLARRATTQQLLSHWEAYMRMAMRVQNQCRMTLETLATLKNPSVVYAKQANVNNGGQFQVNNGGAQPSPSSAPESGSAPKELLEASDGKWLDTGATGQAVGSDPVMAAVGAINGTNHDRGQGKVITEPVQRRQAPAGKAARKAAIPASQAAKRATRQHSVGGSDAQ